MAKLVDVKRIKDALNTLAKENLLEFIDKMQYKRSDNFKPKMFQRAQVTGKIPLQLADLLVESFSTNAVEVTVSLLRACNFNNAANILESQNKDLSEEPGKKVNKRTSKVKKEKPKDKMSENSGKLTLQLKKYKGKTFKWLLKEDLQWAAYVVATHRKLRLNANQSPIPLMKNKDDLSQYVSQCKSAEEAVLFYEQGLLPVGFGKNKKMSREELYYSKKKEKIRYVEWLRNRKKIDENDKELKATIEYIRYRDEKGPTNKLTRAKPKKKKSSKKRPMQGSSSQPAAKKQRSGSDVNGLVSEKV